MYATKLLSLCRKDPSILSESPADEAPNSGYLVITDEETEEQDTCCWGTCPDSKVRNFPFPQNKILKVMYTYVGGENQHTEVHKVLFIPVLDQPLSSNRYYVIQAEGKYKGQACTCSTEEDMTTCCFCNCVKDIKPQVLDHRNIYQQVEIFKNRRAFSAKSIAPDGFPPSFLRRKGWTVYTSSSHQSDLSEAHGLDFSLRNSLPDFDFPGSNKSSKAVVVGKWYCPFVFVKEDVQLKDQMKSSLFYEMSLEQYWEEIYTCESDNSKNNTVVVNAYVQKEVNSISGVEVMRENTTDLHGIIWHRSAEKDGITFSLGLSITITDKMRWLQEMGGWSGGQDRHERVDRTEEYRGEKRWNRFGCFVLVERFALRRMDGTLLLTCDFRHVNKIRSKWE